MLPNGKRGRSRYMGSNMAIFEIRGLIKGGGTPPLVRKDGQALVWEPRKGVLSCKAAIRMSWPLQEKQKRRRT